MLRIIVKFLLMALALYFVSSIVVFVLQDNQDNNDQPLYKKDRPPYIEPHKLAWDYTADFSRNVEISYLPSGENIREELQKATISYNHDSDGVGDFTIPSVVAKEIKQTRSCDPLRMKLDNVYLPIMVQKPMLCEVVDVSPDVMGLVVIGFAYVHERSDFIADMILLLLDDGFIILSTDHAFPLSEQKARDRYEEFENNPDGYWWPPSTPRAEEAWSDISNMVKSDIEEPSKEVQDVFDSLIKEARSVRVRYN